MSQRRSQRARTITRLCMVAALAGGLLATGPTVRAQHPADQVTITYWNEWTDPASKAGVMQAISLFEKAHPNIHVQEVDISGDPKILTAITGGKPPDAATLFNLRSIGAWASRGALQNLDTYAKTYGTNLRDYTKAALYAGTHNGHLYALPVEL